MASPKKRPPQDDSRQKQIAKLCGLTLTGSRSGVDAVDGDAHPFEIKSTTTGSVSTARDVGSHTIQKWRKRYWLIASGDNFASGFSISNLYIAHPDDLEEFFTQTEKRLNASAVVCKRVLDLAKSAKATDADLEFVQDLLARRGITLNNPPISLKLVAAKATELSNDPVKAVKEIRAFVKSRPLK